MNRAGTTSNLERRYEMTTATTRRAGKRGRSVVGLPTRRPADTKQAVRQPPKDKTPTKQQVKKARDEWGIEPYVTGEYEVIRPGNRGWIVHARLPRKDVTLCGMSTKWVGGAKAVDHDELNCLWCMTRIEAFG